jgi:hypothetical protein
MICRRFLESVGSTTERNAQKSIRRTVRLWERWKKFVIVHDSQEFTYSMAEGIAGLLELQGRFCELEGLGINSSKACFLKYVNFKERKDFDHCQSLFDSKKYRRSDDCTTSKL